MQIYETCKPIQDRLERVLIELIPKSEKPLFHAARYVLENKGKRLRPLLALLTCLDLCGEVEPGYAPACALEMIHNYSLIHDDLPCMDNDDFRRGNPSVHKEYSEAIAVLLGDFFLTHAFSVILESKDVTNDQKVKLSSLLSHYSGGGQLLEGQVLDLSMTGKIGHYYDLLNIYLRKTSSLFCCALEFGAVLANKHKDLELLLKDVGQKIGLAFQIKNDFQGKSKDSKQEKFTIFALHTEKQASLLIKKNVEDAIELLEKSGHSFEYLIAFIESMFSL
ncbi:MAG: hypothetical protein S4CHLAM6_00670 [Chlamydiae bacterium]|nr:hypothetical protein [Chlamydiota bacterium]